MIHLASQLTLHQKPFSDKRVFLFERHQNPWGQYTSQLQQLYILTGRINSFDKHQMLTQDANLMSGSSNLADQLHAATEEWHLAYAR